MTWHRFFVTSELSLLLPTSERVALQRFAIVWGLVWQICIPCQSANHASARVQASLAFAPILPVICIVVRGLTWLDPRSRHHGTTQGMLVVFSGVEGLMRRIVVARLRRIVLPKPALRYQSPNCNDNGFIWPICQGAVDHIYTAAQSRLLESAMRRLNTGFTCATAHPVMYEKPAGPGVEHASCSRSHL